MALTMGALFGTEVTDASRADSERVRAVLARFNAGLGACRCGALATTLLEGADGPARCARCAADVRSRREGAARNARDIAAELAIDAARSARLDAARRAASLRPRRTLIGYPVVFGQRFRLPDGTVETVEYGAARSSLARGGITLVLDHDDRRVLARQSDGTLRLTENHYGLLVEADIAESDDARVARLLVAGNEAAGSWKGRAVIAPSPPPLRRQTVRELNLSHLSVSSRSRAAYKSTWFESDTPSARRRALRCEADAINRALLDEEVAI